MITGTGEMKKRDSCIRHFSTQRTDALTHTFHVLLSRTNTAVTSPTLPHKTAIQTVARFTALVLESLTAGVSDRRLIFIFQVKKTIPINRLPILAVNR